MQILIVGIGALGGTIAARAIRAGLHVRLAARDNDSAKVLRRSGLRVSGIGGEVRDDVIDIAAVEDYGKGDQLYPIVVATKAQEARKSRLACCAYSRPAELFCLCRTAGLRGCWRTVSAKTGSLEDSQILVPRCRTRCLRAEECRAPSDRRTCRWH